MMTMMVAKPQEGDCTDFVEVDSSGRYGRYNEILGKGASKTVYRAFDEYEGIEVAWNQVKVCDFLQSPQDLERLYYEIHLLKTLKHKNIMKFYTSWPDTSKRNLNFITELFTSGTLRQYRQRHRRVNMRAIKHWCRQILMGLVYLHSQDPPVIHRDLKCDNIFINGNQGEVKIGDLGLAAILRKSKAAHCVGTPEFMAPEVYEEEYNELVDVYSFGMCVLEMVTFEYPYSECNHPAQIYKKVISGTKPEALYKVKDQEVRQFVEKCIATASQRLSARELLNDPFLHIDGLGPIGSNGDFNMRHILRQSFIIPQHSNASLPGVSFSSGLWHEPELEYSDDEHEIHGMELFNNQEEEHFANMDITIKGRRREDGEVFVRLRITDKDGRMRNIYFSFNVEADTALSVATEMVAELDITDYEVTRIAEMIDGELSTLVPGWKVGPRIDESPRLSSKNLCQNCTSNVSSCGSLLDYMTCKSPGCENFQSLHGRFEEITYQIDETDHYHEEGDHMLSSSNLDVQTFISNKTSDELWDLKLNSENKNHQANFAVEHETEIQHGLRWLRERPQMKPKEILYRSSYQTSLNQKMEDDKRGSSIPCKSWHRMLKYREMMKSFHQANNCSFHLPHDDDDDYDDEKQISGYAKYEHLFGSSNPERGPKTMVTGKFLPSPIIRTKSLPVDAVDV